MIVAIVFILFILIGGLIYLFTDPVLPDQAHEVISEITSKEIPELITDKTGFAQSKSVKIWYEQKSKYSNHKGTVLLINGFAAPSTFWHQDFIEPILDAGFQIIRFDNRSVGLSDWMSDWSKTNAYTKEDMMQDALAVLNENNIQKAHVVGISMGGYIAQRIAIEFPERVLSLTALSSTADLNDPEHPKFNWTPILIIKLFLRLKIAPSDKNYLLFFFNFFGNLNGGNLSSRDMKLLGERGLYELHKRRGFNTSSGFHQKAAGRNAKPIYESLSKIRVPTLIAHGKSDRVLSITLAEKYANLIANSKKIWIGETGHMLTNRYIDQVLPEFIKMVEEVERITEKDRDEIIQ